MRLWFPGKTAAAGCATGRRKALIFFDVTTLIKEGAVQYGEK
jgi:hypothetical protein